MARYRLSAPAKADIASLLKRSEELHGREARVRYRGCLSAALRRVATDLEGRSTVDRGQLFPGLRSFHIHHSRYESREVPVVRPVHLIFFRIRQVGIVEIVRILHERMEPERHLGLQDVSRGD